MTSIPYYFQFASMTSSINFTDLTQKMKLLKELHVGADLICPSSAEHKRYIALRREVSQKLLPLFADLEETKMLMYWIRKVNVPSLKYAIKSVDEEGCYSTLGELGDACENSGIMFSLMD